MSPFGGSFDVFSGIPLASVQGRRRGKGYSGSLAFPRLSKRADVLASGRTWLDRYQYEPTVAAHPRGALAGHRKLVQALSQQRRAASFHN